MNVVKALMFLLPVKTSVGGNVYVPPTVCLRSAYTAARAAAYVGCTGSARTNFFTGMWSASGLSLNSFFLEVG
jgi:hypothetical protein